MAKAVDLRTYLLLERAFVRRLQRSWQIQSAPIYEKIAQACNDHQWDRARQYVTDLDMTEVGTENREWITYMLLSCAVFGAQMVAKNRPSFVGVGTFDTFLKQVTNNFLMYLENAGTTRVQAEALQSIAEDEAKTKAAMQKVAWDESKHPRDKEGQFTHASGGGGRGAGWEQPIEGGGPVRARWVERNREAMDAFDDWIDLKEAHKVHVNRVFERVKVKLDAGHPQEEADKLWDAEAAADKEYVASRSAVIRAEKIKEEADAALKAIEPAMKVEVITNISHDVAKRLGVRPDMIDVVHKQPREFDVGNKHFTEAGHFNPATGRIQLNAYNLSYGDAQEIKGVTAHELSHAIYNQLKTEADAEFQRYLKKAISPTNSDEYTEWFNENFYREPGKWAKQVRPEKLAALQKEFPASAVMAKLAGGNLFAGISEEMVKEDGHSAYAESYWTKEGIAARGHTYESAINETTAEITRYLTYPSSWHESKTPSPFSMWTQFTGAMHTWYREEHQSFMPTPFREM